MAKVDWRVVDAVKQEMRCNRCGVTKPMSDITGRLVCDAVKIINKFVSEHEKCEEKKEA